MRPVCGWWDWSGAGGRGWMLRMGKARQKRSKALWWAWAGWRGYEKMGWGGVLGLLSNAEVEKVRATCPQASQGENKVQVGVISKRIWMKQLKFFQFLLWKISNIQKHLKCSIGLYVYMHTHTHTHYLNSTTKTTELWVGFISLTGNLQMGCSRCITHRGEYFSHCCKETSDSVAYRSPFLITTSIESRLWDCF